MSLKRWVNRHRGLESLTRRIHQQIWWLRFFLSRIRPDRILMLPKLLWVSPDRIRFSANAPGSLNPAGMCIVIDGDWDLHAKPLAKLDIFEALEQRYVQGRDWEETRFYKRVLKQIREGQTKWGCRSATEFAERLGELDELFENIRSRGYKTQRELGGNRPWAEIAVRIGRGGEMILLDGRHRLAIAKILRLRSVPVIVWAWHRQWHEFSRELRSSVAESGGRACQPLMHPDLRDINPDQEDSRFETIRNSLPMQRGRLLDMGAKWGYFCHRFEDIGFECVASEVSAERARVLRKLRDAEEKRFDIIDGSVLDIDADREFDVVLALDVLHHYLIEEHSYRRLVTFLQRLRSRCLVFAPQSPGMPQIAEAYRCFTAQEFVAFLLEHTGLKEAREIGRGEGGQPLFLLQ